MHAVIHIPLEIKKRGGTSNRRGWSVSLRTTPDRQGKGDLKISILAGRPPNVNVVHDTQILERYKALKN